MNNPNPFVPQGSLLEQQSKRRSRLKLGVFCVLAVGIIGLAAMLIQGCKREEENPPEADNNPPPVDTNNVAAPTDTNLPPAEASNAPNATATPSDVTPQVPVPPPVVPAAPPTENEYVVVKGDYMAKIAKDHGITLKALRDANPDVQPTRLRIGEKLVIPAGATTGANAAGETEAGVAANGDQIYTVKPGDTLTRIAHKFGVTVKALETENNLTTTKINAGKKLQIPAKPEAGPAPVNAPPATTTAPEPNPSTPPANPPAQQ
ncbi:MAG TPA: LysM peptidoglycan-binding domain-containing protein [Candidatus Sulfotelmatobacter sp.]|nr:LysM peptidoglycan-binding domain-containing protein [Candidatus Sulfotelmatobacter sp.]